jgi:hypothetical protein
MSSDDTTIPRFAKAGVAFLGVEFNDALILFASIFLGLFMGPSLGTGAYLGIPVAGFFINRLYIDWRSAALPGQVRAFLFSTGMGGYSKAFKSRQVVFVGDGVVINTGSSKMLDDIIVSLQTEVK